MLKIRLWIALSNFFIAAILGTMLRFAFVSEIPWLKFKNFLHAHSHVAMLGWLYLALFAFFVELFLSEETKRKRIYVHLFTLTQISVLGMLFSFPFQGYGFVSITFSSLHILLSYVFARVFLKDLKSEGRKDSISATFAKLALIFMVISTVGAWSLGPVMASGLKGSALYYMAVQFFLHFQFNGWFIFGVLALYFRKCEMSGLTLNSSRINKFKVLLIISTILTYALAVAWSNPGVWVFGANSLGVLIQALAALFLFKVIHQQRVEVRSNIPTWALVIWQFAFWVFILKILIQTSVAIPYVATIAYTLRIYVIGFIHLILLGVVSAFLFGLGIHLRVLDIRLKSVKSGLIILFSGIIFSEFLMFLQGTMLWAKLGFLPNYDLMLFLVSTLIPIGILLILISGKFLDRESQSY